MTTPLRRLTGITTSGTPHLGNYAGAIRPALAALKASGSTPTESFYFLADWHALIKQQNPQAVAQSTLEIAATWLACGLNPNQVCLYRQSDIPEIAELNWLLTCVTSKGWLNRAHAFKASVDENERLGNDPEEGITAGLYMYPVLMSADILAFGAHEIPVGKDQVQHVQIARDIAQRFNHVYQGQLVLPEAVVDERVAVLPGLDGRKMSKSYHNTIPLWGSDRELRQLIFSIITDSTPPGVAKDPSKTPLMTLFEAFATPKEAQSYAASLQAGLSWGEAKAALFEQIRRELAPQRDIYQSWIGNAAGVEAVLQEGAARARQVAQQTLRQAREQVGLRSLVQIGSTVNAAPKVDVEVKPLVVKQFMDQGQAFVKIYHGSDVWLESTAFETPKQAGEWVKAFKDPNHQADAWNPAVPLMDDKGLRGQWKEGLSALEWANSVRSYWDSEEKKLSQKNQKQGL